MLRTKEPGGTVNLRGCHSNTLTMIDSRTSRTKDNFTPISTPLTCILMIHLTTFAFLRSHKVRGEGWKSFPIVASKTLFVYGESIDHDSSFCARTFRQILPFYINHVQEGEYRRRFLCRNASKFYLQRYWF
jgi:hypothetical protein